MKASILTLTVLLFGGVAHANYYNCIELARIYLNDDGGESAVYALKNKKGNIDVYSINHKTKTHLCQISKKARQSPFRIMEKIQATDHRYTLASQHGQVFVRRIDPQVHLGYPTVASYQAAPVQTPAPAPVASAPYDDPSSHPYTYQYAQRPICGPGSDGSCDAWVQRREADVKQAATDVVDGVKQAADYVDNEATKVGAAVENAGEQAWSGGKAAVAYVKKNQVSNPYTYRETQAQTPIWGGGSTYTYRQQQQDELAGQQ